MARPPSQRPDRIPCMMKSPLLVFALAFGITLSAQTILDFPGDSTLWGYKLVSFNLPPNGGSTQTLRHYAMAGDTIISLQHYRKLFTDTINDGVYRSQNCVLVGFLRNDKDQINLRDLAGLEHLIFDFAAKVGDTVRVGFDGVVTTVGHQYVGGSLRKRLVIDQGNTNWPLEWLQGIGYSTGQGVLAENFRFYNVGIHKYFELGCMTVGNETVVQNGFDCTWDHSVGIKDNPPPSIEMYPNPTSSHLFLNATGLTGIESAEILSLEGKQIKQITIKDQQASIPVSDLPKGIYLIKLKVGDDQAIKLFVRK